MEVLLHVPTYGAFGAKLLIGTIGWIRSHLADILFAPASCVTAWLRRIVLKKLGHRLLQVPVIRKLHLLPLLSENLVARRIILEATAAEHLRQELSAMDHLLRLLIVVERVFRHG